MSRYKEDDMSVKAWLMANGFDKEGLIRAIECGEVIAILPDRCTVRQFAGLTIYNWKMKGLIVCSI